MKKQIKPKQFKEHPSYGLRDERIDSLKYCLMILVIAGHVFSQSQFSGIFGCTETWNWIYMFHMPLFVFLSGYFSRKKCINIFLSSCWKLIEPLILFQSIILGYKFMGGGDDFNKGCAYPVVDFMVSVKPSVLEDFITNRSR